MSETTLDSWDGIVDNYLKADNLKGKKGAFICNEVTLSSQLEEDGTSRRPLVIIETVIDGVKYKFTLNWTNLQFVKSKLSSPSELRGKSILWEKIRVKNPKTNLMQDGIGLVDIQ